MNDASNSDIRARLAEAEKRLWKDVTSYSQNCKDRTPKTFEARLGQLRVIVTRSRYYPGDTWIVRCHAINIDQPLEAKDLDDAFAEARAVVAQELATMLKAVISA